MFLAFCEKVSCASMMCDCKCHDQEQKGSDQREWQVCPGGLKKYPLDPILDLP